MAYHGALADDAAAAHYPGTVTLLLLLAQVAFLAAPLLRFFCVRATDDLITPWPFRVPIH